MAMDAFEKRLLRQRERLIEPGASIGRRMTVACFSPKRLAELTGYDQRNIVRWAKGNRLPRVIYDGLTYGLDDYMETGSTINLDRLKLRLTTREISGHESR